MKYLSKNYTWIVTFICPLWKSTKYAMDLFSGEKLKLGSNLTVNTYGIAEGFVTLNAIFGIEVLLSQSISLAEAKKLFASILSENTYVPSVFLCNDVCFVVIRRREDILLRTKFLGNYLNLVVPMSDAQQAHLRFQASIDGS